MPTMTNLYTNHNLNYQDTEGWRDGNEGKAECTLVNKDPCRRKGGRLGSHYHIVVKVGRPETNAGPVQRKSHLETRSRN